MTVLEWFIKELDRELCLQDCCDDFEWQFENIINKALEMEKQQSKPQTIVGEHSIQMLEISDEEIEKAAREYANNEFDKTIEKDEWLAVKIDFMEACKWYREQLKQRK